MPMQDAGAVDQGQSLCNGVPKKLAGTSTIMVVVECVRELLGCIAELV